MKKFSLKTMIRTLLILCVLTAGVFFMRVHVFAAQDEEMQVDNGIPVVYLDIDETQGTIQEMYDSPDHSVYCYGTVSINVPEGFHYADYPDVSLESLEGLKMSIRGRGNTTWSNTKKPFKIKLDKKTDVLGLGKNKHWVLIANWNDSSLLRDRITAWLGDKMDMGFTPRGVPVDVIMRGQEFGTRYLGSYYLSENVRVDENRLEIEELSEDDTDPQIITGGYLIQNASQLREGSPDRFFTRRGAEWGTHTPSFDTEADNLFSVLSEDEDNEREDAFVGTELEDAYKNNVQQEYIQKYIQDFEDILFEGGTAYRKLMDIKSAAKYWLVNMFSMNTDGFATGSTYIYKDRDPEGGTAKLFWGPLWDFDYAWNYSSSTSGLDYGHLWMMPMFRDKAKNGFIQEVHKQWPKMKKFLEKLIAQKNGVIDKFAAETKASAEQDYAVYRPDRPFDYLKEVDKLKNWIIARIAWFDANIDMIDTLVMEVRFIKDGEPYKTALVRNGYTCDEAAERPEKDGYIFLGWEDQDGNIVDDSNYIQKDLTLTAKYLSESEATHAEDIVFPRKDVIIGYNVHVRRYLIDYTIIPEDAIDKRVKWTSSDEDFATVNDLGEISINGPGTATFTAELKYGKTKTFTLTVTKEEITPAESIKTDPEEITLSVGEQAGVTFETNPTPAWVDYFSYESENPDVVTVNENGVITAVSPGTTRIRVEAAVYNTDGSETMLEAFSTVTVNEKILGETEETEETGTAPDQVLENPAPDKGMHWGWGLLIGAGGGSLLTVLIFLLRKKRNKNKSRN